MTHFLVSSEGVLQFSCKEAALRYMKRVRASVAHHPQPGEDWSAPPRGFTGGPVTPSEDRSATEARAS